MKNSNQISVTDANARSVKRDKFTRRGLLGIGGAALAVAGIGPAIRAAGQEKTDRSRSDPGPGNPALDAQNPDSMWPPDTDSKTLIPTFKYPFSLANGPYAAGTGHGAPAHRSGDVRRYSEG